MSSLSSLILAQSVETRRVRDAREAENRKRANSELARLWVGEGDALALKGLFEDVAVFGLSMRELNSRLESLEHFTFKAGNKQSEDRRELT